jgi:hypothetical protein
MSGDELFCSLRVKGVKSGVEYVSSIESFDQVLNDGKKRIQEDVVDPIIARVKLHDLTSTTDEHYAGEAHYCRTPVVGRRKAKERMGAGQRSYATRGMGQSFQWGRPRIGN